MKKHYLWAMLALLLGLMSFAACTEQGGEEPAPLEGTYVFESLSYEGDDGTAITLRAGDNWLLSALTEDTFTFELREDGTATFTVRLVLTLTFDLLWERSETDGYIDITLDGQAETFPCDGETISYAVSGETIGAPFGEVSVTMKKK